MLYMKQFKFEKFSGDYFRGDKKIAINKSGLIRLSSGFCRIVNISKFQYIVLFYDENNNAIALKLTNDSESGAVKITKDKTAATISVKSFIKANNININSYFGRYDWEKITIPDVGEVFVIELNKR